MKALDLLHRAMRGV
jgi:hypothetical protein